ncbi:hypothetical protein [Streptomyces sp. NPDC046859]|uniref:hypothetical protein n=1 Tax=Streptomyces sp. NPDC046859 TaxID=3155734 RepID=UPI0033F50ABF
MTTHHTPHTTGQRVPQAVSRRVAVPGRGGGAVVVGRSTGDDVGARRRGIAAVVVGPSVGVITSRSGR